MDVRRTRLTRLAIVAIVAAALVGSLVTTLPAPAAALDGDSSATYTNPRAPGADGRYTVTLVAERNDTIVRNGLKEITLDFAADHDYSGDITAVTAEDVEVYLEKQNSSGAVSLGAVSVSHARDGRLTVALESAYREVGPGDRIVLRLANVTNTEIAAPDPQGVRSFALRVTTAGPGGNADGPVEVRYEIDPNATQATATTTPAPNASGANGANGAGSDATDTAAPPSGTNPRSDNAVAAVVSGSPMFVGIAALGGVGVVALGAAYVVRRGRDDRSRGPGGGRERL